jgi:hypothetical protein
LCKTLGSFSPTGKHDLTTGPMTDATSLTNKRPTRPANQTLSTWTLATALLMPQSKSHMQQCLWVATALLMPQSKAHTQQRLWVATALLMPQSKSHTQNLYPLPYNPTQHFSRQLVPQLCDRRCLQLKQRSQAQPYYE